MDRIEEINKLKEKCYFCKECPLGRKLVDNLDPHIFAEGDCYAKFIFCAEAGGAEEQKLKRPLVGRCGKFFDEKILGGIGISRDKVWITNGALCRPDEKNRTPLPGELMACLPFLDAQICLIEPKLIITLGNAPLFSVCDLSGGITKIRGKIRKSRIWSNGKTYDVFPITHPSYILRGSGIREMKEDIETLRKIAIDL